MTRFETAVPRRALTKRQKQEALASIYGVPTAALDERDAEAMRQLLAAAHDPRTQSEKEN